MSIPLFVSERSKPQISVRPLSIGCLLFPRMDQIDFTGPFEVLSRMSGTTVRVVGKEVAPIRDVQGLCLTPDVSIADAGDFDVLLIPGGYGQQPYAIVRPNGWSTASSLQRHHGVCQDWLGTLLSGGLDEQISPRTPNSRNDGSLKPLTNRSVGR